ncbi:MAG TPA: exosortase/archaeosortase family protein [Isosphaeraceae bacterium]|nr:exosortase/archaeosortase family protein [Isosphaeraceae bacterium]
MTIEESLKAVPPTPVRFPVAAWITFGVLSVATLAAFHSNVAFLLIQWDNPNYSHGYLVLPIALVILWMHRDDLVRAPVRPNPLGWVALALILGFRYVTYERNEIWLESALIPLVALSLTLALGGWRVLWAALPALAFLLFLLPLPGSLNDFLAGPLQRLATIGSTFLLQIMGLPVLAEGNVIIIGSDRLEVARACNGLSMLSSFVTLITATVLTIARDRPLWERVVLLLSTIPIALIANIIRIAATAWAYYLLGAQFGEKIAHDTAGWAMMPIALALIWLEMRLFNWLVVEESLVTTKQMILVPTTASGPRVVKKK